MNNFKLNIGIKVAGGIIGVLGALAFGIAGYIYFKSCRKSTRRQLSKSFDYQDEEMDRL